MSHARLQLALGSAAVLGEELPAVAGIRRFAARRPSDPPGSAATRLVLVHPPAPLGPARGRMLERMAAIRAVRHASLAAPLATGRLEDETWVVEDRPQAATLSERVADAAPLSVQETVRLLRETARALSALHRAGLSHGALDGHAVECAPAGVRIHRLGHRDARDPAADLHAIGRLGWLALIGREPVATDRRPGTIRNGVPAPLDHLIAALLDGDPAARPGTAEEVLEALDWFPATEATPLRTLIDGAGRGARLPNERRFAIVLAALGLALLVLWLLSRRG